MPVWFQGRTWVSLKIWKSVLERRAEKRNQFPPGRSGKDHQIIPPGM
jgi:hypothetical protein